MSSDVPSLSPTRNLEDLPNEQIAVRMNRSPGAVRMLWVRALAALKEVADQK